MNTTLDERELLTAFIMYCETCGYGSAYDQRDCIDSFITRIPQIEQTQQTFLNFPIVANSTIPEKMRYR